MAAEVSSMTNGYAPSGYNGIDTHSNAYNGTPSSQMSTYQPPAQEMASSSSTQPEVPKDEVGWYFVEQYYTTLSRSPEKLYLFYNKRSQFVSGQETDKVPVCVGQRAINDRIKELDFVDCKVRVTNVDSQASDSNIIIQVIGEISNKSQPHKKFTQTFVLATQTNGYFVLNDIFRYLIEEEDEESEQPATQADEEVQSAEQVESGVQEPAPTAAEGAGETLTSSDEPATVEHDAEKVDEKLEEAGAEVETEETPAAAVNGEASNGQTEHTEDTAPAPTAENTTADDEPKVNGEAETSNPAEGVVEPEKQEAPAPSPVPTPATQAPPQAPAVPKPAVPKTWASLAASANRGAVTPAPTAPQQAPAQPRQAAPRPQAQQAPAQAPAPAAAPSPAPSAPATTSDDTSAQPAPQDEWTPVGSSHNRSQSRHTEQQQQQQGPQNRGYIKNVTESVKADELKAKMEQYGEIVYFDIARQKTCAFVDFKTAQQYQAAVAANPHTIGDSVLYVEERRIRPGSTPYVPRGTPYANGSRGGRGGNNGQGPPRGDFGGRGGGGGGRGGFNPRGRGAPPRGRGGVPAQS